MAHLGHPLTGDFLYGTEDTALIRRPALHSAELELVQPLTGVLIRLLRPAAGRYGSAFALIRRQRHLSLPPLQ